MGGEKRGEYCPFNLVKIKIKKNKQFIYSVFFYFKAYHLVMTSCIPRRNVMLKMLKKNYIHMCTYRSIEEESSRSPAFSSFLPSINFFNSFSK